MSIKINWKTLSPERLTEFSAIQAVLLQRIRSCHQSGLVTGWWTVSFVSNQEVAHGTGNIVSWTSIILGTTTIHSEETAWKNSSGYIAGWQQDSLQFLPGTTGSNCGFCPRQGGYPIQITYGDSTMLLRSGHQTAKLTIFLIVRKHSLWVIDSYVGKEMPKYTYDLPQAKKRCCYQDGGCFGKAWSRQGKCTGWSRGNFMHPVMYGFMATIRGIESQQLRPIIFIQRALPMYPFPPEFVSPSRPEGPDYQTATRQLPNMWTPDTITTCISRWEIPASFVR